MPHEARIIRDAEQVDPGVVHRSLIGSTALFLFL
jgi:hypothetical protein